MSWLKHSVCRACGYAAPTGPPGIKAVPTNEKLVKVFDLGLQPLSNAFAKADEPQSAFYPLEVLFCPRCTLAQLSCTVSPETLYSNYPYVTSKSATMQAHFEALWAAIKLECEPESMCEIGSNDGDFLAFARNKGVRVCGIDPAENLADAASARGLQTFRGVLDVPTAQMAWGAMVPINLVVARHVFCHVDDWHAFVKALDFLCNKQTLVVIEVPYVLDLLQHVQFDTIYHEHTSYLSLKAMEFLLESTPFHMHKVQRFPIHGGAIVVMLRRDEAKIEPHESVAEMVAAENITERSWLDFADAVRNKIWDLQEMVKQLKEKGKTIAGFGASAKATVWLNACKFTRKEISFVCDSTPQKQYRFVPGTDVPVTDEGALLRELPQYAILTAWNFKAECIEKQKRWQELGGRFIVPVPKLEIM